MAFTINGTSGINLATQPLTGALPDANAPSGSVLQVLQSVTTSTITTTSSSPQQTGLTVTITPLASTSKFLLIVNGGNSFNDILGAEIWYMFGRNIGGAGYTVLNSNQQYGLNRQANGSSNGKAQISTIYLDSPNTTSQIVYQPYFSTNGGGGTAYFNQGSVAVTFTVMEIAG